MRSRLESRVRLEIELSFWDSQCRASGFLLKVFRDYSNVATEL